MLVLIAGIGRIITIVYVKIIHYETFKSVDACTRMHQFQTYSEPLVLYCVRMS